MRWLILLLLLCQAARADVSLKNDTGERLSLEVRGNGTVQTSIEANTLKEVGGPASEVRIVVKDEGGKVLCQGTFHKGDRVEIHRAGKTVTLVKRED